MIKTQKEILGEIKVELSALVLSAKLYGGSELGKRHTKIANNELKKQKNKILSLCKQLTKK